ncbi:BspA family leucine-rich repeat surface protein [Lactobacillus curvatus]|nr:BspA family leucine-rich repeat surface protein [Latilactobacillus curvatus]
MLMSSIITTEVNAVEAPVNASSEMITKIAQAAISGSTPTKQSNSVIQKKAASSTETQTITPATSDKKAVPLEAPQTKKASQPKKQQLDQRAGTSLGTVTWYIDDTTATLHLSGGVLPDKVANDTTNTPWTFPNSPYIARIAHISIDGEITAKDVSYMFWGLTNLTTVQGLANLKGATNFTMLFASDSALQSVDATNLDFSKVTAMSSMFSDCENLVSVGDTANWQLGQVTTMASCFRGDKKLNQLNSTNWDTANIQNMNNTFYNCTALTNLDVSKWQTTKMTNLGSTFSQSGITALDVSNWDTSHVTNLNGTFLNTSIAELDVSNWDTGQVTTMDRTFAGCANLNTLDVSKWQTAKNTSLSYTFSGDQKLTQLDVSKWQTANVTNMASTFSGTVGVKTLDVKNWQTAKVTTMAGMFANSGIDQLEIADWDTSNVKSMRLMFDATKLTTLNYPNWNTASVTDMSYMLRGMTKLTDAYFTNWDTRQVTNMAGMFLNDQQLAHLRLGPKFKFLTSTSTGPSLAEPSTETPYFGKWQRHDAADNQVGNTYTSAALMAQYDGTTVPTGDYYWAVATPPTITKLVRNVTADGNNAPFKTATTAQKGDIVEYQVNITQPSGQKLDRGAIFKDVLDSHLKLDSSKGLMIAYATAGSDFDMFQLINFNDQWQFATGQTMEIGQKAQVKIKATVADDSVSEIDNLFKLVSGSYGAGTISNTAIVHVKKPLKLTKAVKNETTNTNWATKQDVNPGDQVGFTLDYQNTTGATSNQITFNDPLVTNELAYQTGSLKVTYQDGTTETVSDAAQTQFATTGKLTLTKSLANYEAVKLSFSATVNPLVTSGTTLHNTATVTADNVSQPVTSNTVDMNVVQSEHQLTIRYVDLDEDLSQPTSAGTQIAAPITVTGKTGTALSTLLPGQQVAPKVIDGYTIYAVTEDRQLNSADWQKAYRDDPVVGEKDRVITYGYKKAMLSIDAPSSWEFDDYNTKPLDRTYYLKHNHGTPQAVTVTDDYGVQNWQLQISQAQPFVDSEQHELTDAKWVFSNGNVKTLSNTDAGTVMSNGDHFTLASGQTATLMTMTKNGRFQTDSPDTSDSNHPYTQVGQGQWAYRFGDEQSADYSIGLNVPATTKRYVGRYHTKLTWSLSVAP